MVYRIPGHFVRGLEKCTHTDVQRLRTLWWPLFVVMGVYLTLKAPVPHEMGNVSEQQKGECFGLCGRFFFWKPASLGVPQSNSNSSRCKAMANSTACAGLRVGEGPACEAWE